MDPYRIQRLYFCFNLNCFNINTLRAFFEQLSLIITYSGIVQGIYVVLLLNNRNVRSRRADIFLSILLIALSISTFHSYYAGVIIKHLSVEIYSVGDPTFLLIAPLLWFYVVELTGVRVVLSWNLISHFTPFLFIVILSLTFRSVNPDPSFLSFLNHHHKLVNVSFWIIVVVQFSFYLYFTNKKWVDYQARVQQEVSNKENVDIAWVRFFMMVFLLLNVFFFFSLFAAIHLADGAWLPKTTAVLFSLSIFALGYKGTLQHHIFQSGGKISPNHAPASVPADNTLKSHDEELVSQLVRYMVEKKPFLEADLTLSQLAKDFNISRSQLSVLINEGTGDNFYDFINKFRVEEVKRLMVDPGLAHFSLLGIALEAGFKSKSSFNLIFKRFTGLTPSAYRNNILPK